MCELVVNETCDGLMIPPAVGHTSTHAVVMARLITKGKDYGMHPFIVQLRSLKDHTPLPGTYVQDIFMP